MCQFHPEGLGGHYDCSKTEQVEGTSGLKAEHYRRCPNTISIPFSGSMEDEWRYISANGWVVVPHTGTFIFCSQECAWPWAYPLRIKFEDR